MVKLRLKRFGRTNRPHFRLNAMDIRTPRNGAAIEELGFYDPIEKDPAKAMKINVDRVKYWLSVGAQPSLTVQGLLKKVGIEYTFKRKSLKPTHVPQKPKKVTEAAAKPGAPAAPAAPAAS